MKLKRYQNKTEKIGYLKGDPRPGETGSGVSVCNFRLLVIKRYKKDGEWHSKIEYGTEVSLFARNADELNELLGSGDLVEVVGRDCERPNKVKNGDGSPVLRNGKPFVISEKYINANSVKLLKKKGEKAAVAQQQPAAASPAAEPAASQSEATPPALEPAPSPTGEGDESEPSTPPAGGGEVPPSQPSPEGDGASASPAPAPSADEEEPVVSEFEDAHIPATSGARKLAAKLRVDLSTVTPSGRKKVGDDRQQVTQKDVKEKAAEKARGGAEASASEWEPPASDGGSGAEEPPVKEPQAEAPATAEPPVAEPQAEAPAAAEPPVADEPPVEGPQADAPAVAGSADEPQAEAPATVEPPMEEPPAEAPVADEPATDEPQAEEPVVEEEFEDDEVFPDEDDDMFRTLLEDTGYELAEDGGVPDEDAEEDEQNS